MQHSHAVPADGINNTNRDAGTLVSPSSPVDLEISTGPKRISLSQYLPTALFGILGLIILAGIVYAIIQPSGEILRRLRDKDAARGLITFLIAIATVGIAIVLAISTLIPTEGDKRFDRGKQVLSILIGVLGTIVGFYFGAETNSGKPSTELTQTSAPKITTTTLPDGAVTQPYSVTLQTTGLTPPLKWTVTPALPDGLVLDAAAGTIKGTPKAALPKTTFKFTVTDSAAPACHFDREPHTRNQVKKSH